MKPSALIVALALLAGCGSAHHAATTGSYIGPEGPLSNAAAAKLARQIEARCRKEHNPCNALGAVQLSAKEARKQAERSPAALPPPLTPAGRARVVQRLERRCEAELHRRCRPHQKIVIK